ncbi:peptide chain release factor 1-like, mitochondrial [Ctenodactylus gundi]
MRCRLLWSAARGLWGRRAPGQARRPFGCSRPPPEDLFARGGPLRTFLQRQERQAESGTRSQVRCPELVAVGKLLSEKERELREIEPLLRDENEDLRKLAEHEITLCQKEIIQLKNQVSYLYKE